MALLKGLAIVLPFWIAALLSWRGVRIGKEYAYASTLVLIIILFTPISARGVVADYLLWMILGSTMMGPWISAGTRPRQRRTLAVLLSIGILIIYVPCKSTFGSFLSQRYSAGGLDYRLYTIPDMVASPQHRLEVSRPFLFVELELYSKRVSPRCNTFLYDEEDQRLVVSDTCGTPSLPTP